MDYAIDIDRLIAARDKAARIIILDPSMAQAFEALDRAVQAREANDPVARARAIAARGSK
jgi:hypothetical protein